MTAEEALERLFESLEDAHKLSEWRHDKLQLIRAELESLRRDAERYRFIRGKIGYDSYGVTLPCGNSKVIAQETDAAIDAALEADNG